MLKKRGFTLIELLVVIAIIGLLAGIVGMSVGKWRQRARDSQRISDINTLQKGLAFYYHRSEWSGAYPIGDVYFDGSVNTVSTALINSGSMTAIPFDPINEGDYRYHYVHVLGDDFYTLTYFLETAGVPGQDPGSHTVGP